MIENQPLLAKTVQASPVQSGGLDAGSTGKSRTFWIDNLRTFMILLVVNMHVCVTYGHLGSWYYESDQAVSLGTTIAFAFWQAHLQSFFMGLLFFIGGYYANRSLARRGRRSFIKERLLRLGLPTLLYMLAIQPLILLVINPWHVDWVPFSQYYPHYLISGKFLSGSGPMWFTFALLVFSFVFFLVYGKLRTSLPPLERLSGPVLLAIGVTLGVAAFLVRCVQPIGTSVINMQLCNFCQYIAAFVLGIYVARRNGLEMLSQSPVAKRAGWIALVLGPLFFFFVAWMSLHVPHTGLKSYAGGVNVVAFTYAIWEQLTGFGLGLGCCYLFASRFSTGGALARWLSDRSFGVYFLHAPILVELAYLFRHLPVNPFVHVALLTTAGLVISFLAADLARRVPLLNRIV